MISHNVRAFAYTIIGLAFGTYILIFLFTQDLNRVDYYKAIYSISITITLNIFIWIVFIKWFWKLKIFYPWLVRIPDLSGKWEGTTVSNWNNRSEPPIPMEININQTFLDIRVKILTGESRSSSIAASFDISDELGQHQLFYSYLSVPNASIRDRSVIHYGSAKLIFDGFHTEEMEGEYWTSRETTGEIYLRRANDA